MEGIDVDGYLHDMDICQEFARLNREAMLDVLIEKMGIKKRHILDKFCTIHNYIDIKNGILRKGAISLQKDEIAIIPGSMEYGSLIVKGKGNPDWNFSEPHGFGRKLSRSKAKETLKMEEFKDRMKNIYSTSSIKALESKFNYLSYDKKININEFLTVRIILSLLIFIVSIYYFNSGYFIAPILTFLFYIFFEYICIDVKIKKRARKLESDAIFFFEVLNLTIQSERNLKLCISITSKSIDSDLSTEFKRMLDEVGYGKSLTEGLRDLMKRIPSKSVCNVILNIIEANEFGNSIEGALTNQINYLTDKRILDIKESINKMPMKISIVSVLLFLPLMMLLILGPIFINYILK